LNKARIKITLGFINLLRGSFCNLFISTDIIFNYYGGNNIKLDIESVNTYL